MRGVEDAAPYKYLETRGDRANGIRGVEDAAPLQIGVNSAWRRPGDWPPYEDARARCGGMGACRPTEVMLRVLPLAR